jgi:medium-chain acyl-[acyl-carrier-protein] hydrolase
MSLRLFVLPPAGGSAITFGAWKGRLPDEVALQPLVLPGHGARLGETLLREIECCVELLVPTLLSTIDGSFALFGHSMGALLAFELARMLTHVYALPPAALFVSGRQAPQLPSTTPRTHDWPEPDFIAHVRELNGTPPELLEDADALDLVIPVLRADFQIVDTYVYQPGRPLTCPIQAFGGTADHLVPLASLEGWRDHTTDTFSLTVVEGDHFSMLRSDVLLDTLGRACLQAGCAPLSR